MKIYIHPKVEDFVSDLSRETKAKTLRTIDLLEEFGHTLDMPHSKKVEDKLFELRVRGKREVRIFYAFKNRSAVLLHGFIKKSEKLPRREIETAKLRLEGLA